MKRFIVSLIILTSAINIASCTMIPAVTGQKKLSIINEIKYSNKGSRSEGRSWYLKINGKAIPDCFTMVAAEGKVYSFRSKNTTWGDDGYIPADGDSEELYRPGGNEKLSDSDISRGWREGDFRYSNTPAHWIFVKWNGGSASVSVEKIDELIRVKSIKTIQRNTLFDKLMKE